jgi:hypothetical protein
MPRLVVNPDTAAAWEIPLQPGVVSVGRTEENDVPIDHASVSTAHCQITIDGAGARIKDLGSSNGTFVNGELIEDAPLRNRQTIRVGDVLLRYEADEMPEPPLPPSIATATVPGSTHCKVHPRNPARFSCPHCGNYFCELCVSSRREQGRMAKFCRVCSVECTPVTLVATPEEERSLSFGHGVRGAFAYPLKGDGVILLIAGGVFFLLIDAALFLARFAPVYGFVALIILTVFGTGYMVSYLRRIVTASAAGDNRMPDWPEITEFGSDVLSPFFQLLGTVAFCFAPAIALTLYVASSAPENTGWLAWLIFASIMLSSVYFPMAFLAVAMFDSVMAVNPLLIIPSILKIPGTYFLTIVLFVAVLIVRWLGYKVLPVLLHSSFVAWIIASFLGLYLLMVEVRILGVLYWTRKNELGWFRR